MEMHLKAGMTLVVESGMTLSLNGPGGFIKIDAMGVTIQGTMVKINSGGSKTAVKGATVKTPKEPDKADDVSKGDKL